MMMIIIIITIIRWGAKDSSFKFFFSSRNPETQVC